MRLRDVADYSFVATGPLVLGATLHLSSGWRAALHGAVGLAGTIGVVALIMLPTLYIGGSVLGVLPGATRTTAAALRGLRAFGIVLLGLAPPAAFLLATGVVAETVLVLGALVLVGAMLCGMAVLYGDLTQAQVDMPLRFPAFFFAWAIVGCGIGARLFVEHVL
jgi:hypothetical protein